MRRHKNTVLRQKAQKERGKGGVNDAQHQTDQREITHAVGKIFFAPIFLLHDRNAREKLQSDEECTQKSTSVLPVVARSKEITHEGSRQSRACTQMHRSRLGQKAALRGELHGSRDSLKKDRSLLPKKESASISRVASPM